jgi:2-polyprenyl-6-methoxyphenol hydroxylase-like FAD-dependent oxidoreductase
MTTTRTALVIGAGIAGPVAAMALRKAGIQPTIYEARPGGAEGTGTFLTIASNGIDALRVIGADEPALGAGFPTPAITLRSTTGKNLGGTRTGLALPDGTTSHTLKRADLYRALYEEAVRRGIVIKHGKRLAGARQTGGEVHAVFEDGSDAVADVLIGADGHPLRRPKAHRPARPRAYLHRPGQPRRARPRRASGRRARQLHDDLREAGILRLRSRAQR